MLDGSSYPAVIGLFARATTLRAMFARSSITALVAALVVLTFAIQRASGAPWLRPRPSDVPAAAALASIAPSDVQLYNDYASPERTYISRSTIVHYVVVGIDAPPLNDDDANGTPDYVERVGDAADRALAYYERRGFRTRCRTKADRMRGPTSTCPAFHRGRSGLPSRPAERRAEPSSSSRTTSTQAPSAASAASTQQSPTSSSTSSSSPIRPRERPADPDLDPRGNRRRARGARQPRARRPRLDDSDAAVVLGDGAEHDDAELRSPAPLAPSSTAAQPRFLPRRVPHASRARPGTGEGTGCRRVDLRRADTADPVRGCVPPVRRRPWPQTTSRRVRDRDLAPGPPGAPAPPSLRSATYGSRTDAPRHDRRPPRAAGPGGRRHDTCLARLPARERDPGQPSRAGRTGRATRSGGRELTV